MKKYLLMLMVILFTATTPGRGADIEGQGNTTIFSDVMTEIYYEVAGYTSTPYKVFDSTMVKNRWNAAARDVAFLYRCVQRDTTLKMTGGTETYALPSDFYEIRNVMAKATGTNLEIAMQEVAANEFGLHRDDTGIPGFYMREGYNLKVTPTNTSGDSVRVYYAARNNVLSANTDTTNLDKEYITLTVLDASIRLLRAKVPSMGDLGEAMVADLTKRKALEEKRLIERNKSLFQIIAK